MTETDEGPLVSYVIATYNRPDDLADAVDSILTQTYRPLEVVVVSSSTDDTSELFEDDGRFSEEYVHYHEYSERMGVPEARNIGFELAAGDIIVAIDDDATVASPDATAEIVSLFEERADVGVLAFQSRSHQSGELIHMEIPDPPDFRTPPSESYETTCFIGVGSAIRRSVLDEVGGYPSHFVYGFEEMDLSLRVLDGGYDILYTPSVVVYHKQSPKGRIPDTEVQERRIENRIKIAVRNLPWRYVLFTSFVWSAYWFVRSGADVASFGRIFRRLYDQRSDLLDERDVVDADTITRVKSRSDMLFLWWYGPNPRRLVDDPNWDLRRRLSW